MAVPVEFAGKLDNQSKLYLQLHVLNTYAAILIFMTEYVVSGAR